MESSSKKVFLCLALYFLLQLAARLLVSPGLELDEAEQLILTQQMSLGYGSQPPLYTWLLGGVFGLFGVNIFSLALLKNLLLFTTYLLIYRSARELGYSREVSAAAMLSLFLLPQIVWESQRDLTHSVLATTMVAATIFSWLRLQKHPTTVYYLLAGLCWGGGLLAKYNFGIFLVSLLAASATMPEYRSLLANRRMFLSIAGMMAVLSPHLFWVFNNLQTTLSQSGKFQQAAKAGYFASISMGTGNLVMAGLAFSLPLLLVYAVIFLRGRQQITLKSQGGGAANTLLIRSVGAALIICVLMVVLFKVTVFKDRWMQPVLFFLPLALLPWMDTPFASGGGRLLRSLSVVVAVVVLLGLGLRPYLAPLVGSTTRFNLPYRELAAGLKNRMDGVEMVAAQNRLIGGNLRLAYPGIKVVVPEAPLFRREKPRNLLAVWHAETSDDKNGSFRKLVAALMDSGFTITGQGAFQAPMLHIPGKTATLCYARVDRSAKQQSPMSSPVPEK